MDGKLKEKDIEEYAVQTQIINTLYKKKKINDKEYNYAKILLKQSYGIICM